MEIATRFEETLGQLNGTKTDADLGSVQEVRDVYAYGNQDAFNYVPPHRGARLDGGTTGALNNDNSIDGGWSDRSTLGSGFHIRACLRGGGAIHR